MTRFRIAREGIPLLLLLAGLTIAIWIFVAVTHSVILFWIATVLTMVTAAVILLFRDPRRVVPDLSDLDIISPADGKIVNISTVDETEFLMKKALRVSIFLSLPDVHINWVPVSGVVMHRKCSGRKFLPAFTKKAGDNNKRISIGIECADGFRMIVVQIAGFVARRIKCHLTPGQKVQRGERYGMIYFGSRVDVLVPAETKLSVKKGDRVQGGITVIGQKNSHNGENKNATS